DAVDWDETPSDLAPIALVVLAEHVREDAAATLAYFAQQGVAVKVISGDNPRTVAAIAGAVGVPGADDPMDARQLPDDEGGLAGLPFPFLPRHLTIVSSLTIGIPAFFLALAPNAQRFRAGFVTRVLRFALPAGFVAAAATFSAYAVAHDHQGATLIQTRTTA